MYFDYGQHFWNSNKEPVLSGSYTLYEITDKYLRGDYVYTIFGGVDLDLEKEEIELDGEDELTNVPLQDMYKYIIRKNDYVTYTV